MSLIDEKIIVDKEAVVGTLTKGLDTPSTPSTPSGTEDAKALPPAFATNLAEGNAQRADSVIGSWILQKLGLRSAPEPTALDEIATQPSIWDTPQVETYKKLLVRPDWENLSAFDPSFRWTWREEREVRRACDWKIMAWACVMFFALDLDRGNIGNATSDNLLKDLKLTNADYNLGNTLAKLGFLIAELPSQLISKRLGPDRWIPMQITAFGVVAATQFFLTGRSTFLACRFLVAIFQGGFIPDTILYLSYFYPSKALPIRLAWFWGSQTITGIATGFLAVGLLKLRGVLGYAGWRWMFLIEGIITVIIGIISFFMMPTAPTQTKTRFRPKGLFTDRQVKIIVNSVIRDDPGKATMHNRQALTFKELIRQLGDYDLYPLYLIGLLFGVPGYPVSNYLSLAYRSLGFNVTTTNLLGIVGAVSSFITLMVVTAVSELVDNRSFVSMAEDLWMLPCFIALVIKKDPNGWDYFGMATTLLSYPYVHAIQVAWTSRNAGLVSNRTVSASVYNMMVQASAMIGANVYQASDSPRYFHANKGLIGLLSFNVVLLYPGTWLYYRWRNRSRAAIWDAMTEEEKENYLLTTKDQGNKRLDFRFAY